MNPSLLQSLQVLGIAALATLPLSALKAVETGSPFRYGKEVSPTHSNLIPADKEIDHASLTEREAQPLLWRGEQLEHVGMPISGIGTGQLYLGGDGTLWYWGIFNQDDIWSKCEGYRYLFPHKPEPPLEQGFAVRWQENGRTLMRPLSAEGFSEITFEPRFPVGRVTYRDPAVPFTVSMEVFTPWIPLNLDRSSWPAALFGFTVSSTGQAQAVEVLGWIENYSLDEDRGILEGKRTNSLVGGKGYSALITDAYAERVNPVGPAETVLFENFSEPDFSGWTVTGEAFGEAPDLHEGKTFKLQGKPTSGKLANSMRPSDEGMGTLLSDPFTITHPLIELRFASGRMPHAVGLRLIVDGEPVRLATGIKPRRLIERSWNVADYLGQTARIEIFDETDEDTGYVIVDEIRFTQGPGEMPDDLNRIEDHGQLALALLSPETPSTAVLDLDGHPNAATVGRAQPGDSASATLMDRPVAALGQVLQVPAGGQAQTRFALSWRFPNLNPKLLRTYGTRWPDIQAQVEELAAEADDLAAETRLFADTWRDSTLPHWLLHRIMVPAVALSTNTVVDSEARIRFTLNEGSSSLGGNCTHVWHYAQSVGRLFPELERTARDEVELGVGLRPNGVINYRAVLNSTGTAVDGTSGTILRVLREHQMSPNNDFLEKVWPRTRKAMTHLIETYDPDENGVTEGFQHNTLDEEWAGDIPWLSSMYLAAVEASAEMARIMDDYAYAERCESIVAKGREAFPELMWDDDKGYFVQRDAPGIKRAPTTRRTRPGESPGTFEGVHIDQVLGEWWLAQLGLEPVLDPDKTRSALEAVFRYNFAPDIGPYREVFQGGRWYAAPGEPGLFMATFPFGGERDLAEAKAAGGYLNENMTGFEWAAAAAMIEYGLVFEGLQVVRALETRYRPEARNPFNEIECGDHYARAMASYSVLLALSGYQYDGPDGVLGFAPRVTPEDFRAPFTAAEGWGTFKQKREAGTQYNQLQLRWGSLRLTTLELKLPSGMSARDVSAHVDQRKVEVRTRQEGDSLSLDFKPALQIKAGQSLTVTVQ